MARSTIPNSLITEWFNIGKEINPVKIQRHSVSHPRFGEDHDDDQSSVYTDGSRSNIGECSTKYPQQYQDEEEDQTIKAQYVDREQDSTVGGLSSLRLNKVEELSDTSGVSHLNELLQEESANVYNKYKFKNFVDPKLKITAYREKILNLIEINHVLVIQGDTGSGKTTQVPKFILQHFATAGKHCNIVVTQPRRIAAISIAHRVCEEMGNLEVGRLVGYHIGLDNKTSDDTRLTFLTTGVLLQKLVTTKNLNDYTHVFLDEVHERDQEMDFLMLVVRKLSRTVSKSTKIILMSATVDTDVFADYFSLPLDHRLVSAPVLTVEGTPHRIYDVWVDELAFLEVLPNNDVAEPKLTKEAINLAAKLIYKFDDLERLEQSHGDMEFALQRGTVLIFLPGLEEIIQMCRALPTTANKWKLIKLHSSITGSEQRQAFDRAESGYRKIIIATNIAESSITVPDVKYVIDFCLTKNLVCDPETNYTWLKMEWASRSNLIQRRGRAGRVSDGRVYRMITKYFYDNFLREYSIPEMKRCPLDKVVLHTKMLDIGPPISILGLAMDPPDLSDIERTILVLMQIGALASIKNERGIICSTDGDLTFVGRVIAKLPVDIHLGKLLILGYLFGCLESCIIIAAGLSKKSIFSKPSYDALGAYAKKLYFSNGSFSDCIAIVNAYQMWNRLKENGYFERMRNKNEEWSFGKRVGIEIGGLREVKLLVEELTKRLDDMDICVQRHGLPKRQTRKDQDESNLILKLAIAGAFFPNYFTQSPLDEKMINRTLNGKDPRFHILLSNLPMHQGILYEDQLFDGIFGKKLMPDPQPEYDHTKVIVRLGSNQNTQLIRDLKDQDKSNLHQYEGIALGVYLAVKMRLLRIQIPLYLHPPHEANKLMEEIEQERERIRLGQSQRTLRTARMVASGPPLIERVALPKLQESTIELVVTHIEDCGKFWARYAGQDDEALMKRIDAFITRFMSLEMDSRPSTAQSSLSESCRSSMSNAPLTQGKFCFAPFKEQGTNAYYRGRIESLNNGIAEVFFVDYGNKSYIARNLLRDMEIEECRNLMKIPMQAFECELSNIGACAKRCPSGTWSESAKNYFVEAVEGKKLIGRVFSVVYTVVRLELIYKKLNGVEISLNEELKNVGFAVHKEESYPSKENHEFRRQAYLNHVMSEGDDNSSSVVCSMVPRGLQPSKGKTVIYLRGPESPLEMSFMGLTRGMSFRGAYIEQDSVNSVSLDPEPQDKHARLLVATDVNLSSSGNRLTARSTILMPNFHGLLSLVPLLFAPQVEMRTDKKRTRYTGALCGLGFEEKTNRPLFADHDMEIAFDTLITNVDIEAINYTRLMLNMILGFKKETNEFLPQQIDNAKKRLRSHLLKLFTEERESVEPITFPRQYRWCTVDPSLQMKTVTNVNSSELIEVLPPIQGIQLDELDLRTYIKDLNSKANESRDSMKEFCILCKVWTYSPRDLLEHLATRIHKEHELNILETKDRHTSELLPKT